MTFKAYNSGFYIKVYPDGEQQVQLDSKANPQKEDTDIK